MKYMGKFIRFLSKCCGIALVVMTVVTFMQAVNRYIFGKSFVWAEELTILGMIWITYLGSVIAMSKGGHTRIDFLINMLPAQAKRIVEGLDCILMAGFCAALCYVSIDLISLNITVKTTGLGISRAFMYGALTVGMGLLVAILLLMAICKFIDYDYEGGN